MFLKPESTGQLLVTLIDQYAALDPSPTWAVVPIDQENLSLGFKDVSYRELSAAVSIAAFWLQSKLPLLTEALETIAYTGPKDVRYPIFAIAAAKVGRKLLLPSPFASTGAQAHLVKASECRTFLYGGELGETVQRVLDLAGDERGRSLQVPELEQLFGEHTSPLFPYEKSWNQAKDDPWLIFHTSGTTGMPKLVTYSQKMMASLDAAKSMPDAHEETMSDHFSRRRWYTPLPSLHFVGMTVSLQFPLFCGSVVIIGPATSGPTTPSVAAEVLRHSKAEGVVLPPALIDGLCNNPDGLECLRNLKYIYFAGAPLMSLTAAKLIDYVSVHPAMGSTEAGAYFIRITGTEDWEYYSFRPGMGMELQHVAPGSELHEAVFVRKSELEQWQQVFHVYPQLQEFRTGDLFTRHPTRPDAWKYVGRTDDMIPFSHGENLYVADIETEITTSHPAISAAQVGGQGRSKPYLLVEWSTDSGSLSDAQKLHILQPVLARANERCSDLVKLSRDLILFTHAEKPLMRTLKGSVSRLQSEELYRMEIEQLYRCSKAN
ncbi:putative AMP-binding enzyme [Bimuria novae-zelandiae CBS 107.79]|uniref:Putative AMP-binding enzyme n=1 Tax=Bimuria novae-zelandiae CBS 107.79 TaxID=1447943 RepID=A0A6A5VDL2_9PLEO|nr:putative AMP-binding enzyme [Bimuria novae-zelandiae CBS 107.79]